MDSVSASVKVFLGTRSYFVQIGENLLDQSGEKCRALLDGPRCAIITDSNVGPLYCERVERSLRCAGFDPIVVTVPAGEKSKSLAQADEVCNRMIAAGLDRSAFVVALGGGVVGDLAGFIAAIYYRGIPFVQIPTTIVAQVDSAVGGKTGVNATGGKNLIGAFHQPRLVLADVATLRSLPEREFNEGFAEIIKHAIIRDAAMFGALGSCDLKNLAPLIARNVEIKSAIVSADEHETTGERALLNFGHTVGHAIENAAGYGRFLHGEAISLGIVAACALSMRKAGFSAKENEAVLECLRRFKLPIQLPPEISTDSIMAALRLDKKFARGEVRFVLTEKIGSAFISSNVTLDEIREAVQELRQTRIS